MPHRLLHAAPDLLERLAAIVGPCAGFVVGQGGTPSPLPDWLDGTIAGLFIIGLLYRRVDMFVDIAIAYAMLNFIAVLAASKFLQKRKGLRDD